MENVSFYIYSHLPNNSIRLLGFSAASNNSSCILETFDLNDTPPYFALSYAWATQEQDVLLRVDGRLLLVSHSLADVIQQLRESTIENSAPDGRVRWLWIDKICINQDDIPERSEQVQIMGSIYSQAIRTLIWLGPDADLCSAAWELIDQIYSAFQEENPRAEFVADIPFRLYSERNHAALGLPGWDHERWQHLRKLFELPWFTRTWIIQEVALSRGDPIFVHGRYRYPWYRLGWASSWLRRNGYFRLEQVPNQMQNVETISNIRRSGSHWRLDALLVATSIKCQATDQKDKVYAILGLAVENQDPEHVFHALRSDYELDIADIYTRVTLFFLQEYKSLSVLTRASGVSGDASHAQRKYQFEQLPSWVANWGDFTVVERRVAKSLSWLSHPDNADPAALGFPEHYNASAGLPARLFESPHWQVLRLGGLRADAVVSVTRFDGGLHPLEGFVTEPPLLKLWRAVVPFLPDGAALLDWVTSWVKATTAEQHRLTGRTAEQILKDGSACLLSLLSSNSCEPSFSTLPLCGDGNLIPLLEELSVGGDPESYATLASNFCYNRKFIITSGGRMGIGPTGTQPGDVICVIFGGGVPYILRAQESRFLFVGESYIYGLMDGEAIRAWKLSELAEEIVVELQ